MSLKEKENIRNHLNQYNKKTVRIIDKNDEIFDGICEYYPAVYGEIKYGVNEESLEI